MSTEVKSRRGTTLQHSTFVGAVGEITVDTDKHTAVVHDGATAGGFPLEKSASRDASGGHVGLTAFKINFLNTLGTITSWFANSATAVRTYTFPDKSMTVGDAAGDNTIVTVGALNSGSITSGFGSIDVGTDSISGGAGAFSSVAVAGPQTATSFNKVAVTQPATGSTLTIVEGATLTASASANISGTNTGDQTSVAGNAGTATALQTARNIDGVSFDGTTNIKTIAPATLAAPAKTTPIDADFLPMVDSAATNLLKKLLWSDIKVALANFFASAGLLLTGANGLGYGTGSGGAVAQITSRTTGVTLDKTNGAITLFSAAGSASWQSVVVTNSTVAVGDVPVVVQKSGTDLYQIFVTNVAAGSFQISFATTGGTTTETPVFSFAILKAVEA